MIISKTPLRITLAGGGTDLPDFYSRYGGCVTSMAIDKYIYISFKKNILENIIRLSYLKIESVDSIDQLRNERARETIRYFIPELLGNGRGGGFEISSISDLPCGSGLGSSGSYLVGLINLLQHSLDYRLSKKNIADIACHIEIDVLNEPVGKQDQFIAAYGGITTFTISKDGNVIEQKLYLENPEDFLSKNRIYYTGLQRNASNILQAQKEDIFNFERRMLKIQEISHMSLDAIKRGDYDMYGELLNQHWQEKRLLNSTMTNHEIDSVYNTLLENDYILGGKIIGAGGGGFLLLYSHKDHCYVDEYMKNNNFIKLDYKISQNGSEIVYDDTRNN